MPERADSFALLHSLHVATGWSMLTRALALRYRMQSFEEAWMWTRAKAEHSPSRFPEWLQHRDFQRLNPFKRLQMHHAAKRCNVTPLSCCTHTINHASEASCFATCHSPPQLSAGNSPLHQPCCAAA